MWDVFKSPTTLGLGFLVALTISGGSLPAAAQGNSNASPPAHVFTGEPVPGVARGHETAAIQGSFDPRGLALGAHKLRIALPDNDVAALSLQSVDRRGAADLAWNGVVDGVDDSDAMLTLKHGRIFGRIRKGHQVYELSTLTDGDLRVAAVDLDALPGCSTDEAHVHADDPALSDTSGSGAAAPASAGDGSVEIDLLVVYSRDALQSQGNDTLNMEAFIQAAVDAANTSFANSNMSARYRLVHTALLNYDTLNSTGDDLSNIRSNAYGSDSLGILALRNQYGADMVHLLVDTTNSCGTAYVQRSPGAGFEDWAYAVTDVDCAVGNLTFAHEHGHNMGFEHNPENSSATSSTASYPYSFGNWVSGSFRTVMSYSNPCSPYCSRTSKFSNPDITHNGYPTGVANERDNARTGDQTAPIVAGFREAVTGPGLIANPGFEQDFSGWTDLGNSAIETADVRSGSKAARIGSGAGGRSQQVSELSPDTEYSFCGWSYALSPANDASMGISIYNASDALLATHSWDIDWTSWQRNSATFTYPSSGSYAEVWVQTQAGSSLVYADDFSLAEGSVCASGNLPPTADFSFTTQNLVANLLNYAYDAEGTLVSHLWDFGDGNSSTEHEPVHTYAAGGNYQVTLTVTDDGGLSDNVTKTVNITGPAAPPEPDPMTFATAPYVFSNTADDSVVRMVATVATDVDGGIEYKFECEDATIVAPWNGCDVSAWQTSTTYTDSGLIPGTTYRYRVLARDSLAQENTPSSWQSIAVPEPPPPSTLHVGDLDATGNSSNRWTATITIIAHDNNHAPQAGVTVEGAWSNGVNGGGSCVTNSSGVCSVSKRTRSDAATFSVTSLSNGSDAYQASDNHDDDGNSNGTAITVLKGGAVVPPPGGNGAPTASNDSGSTEKNVPIDIAVLGNDSDPDGDTLSVTSVGNASNGSTSHTSTQVTYTPNTDFVGTDSFSYTIGDGEGGSDSATVTITVTDPSQPGPGYIYVGGLDGSVASGSRNRWSASVTVTVLDDTGAPQSDVAVSGSWSSGGGASCTTGATGQCQMNKNNLKSNVSSTTLTVSDLSKSGFDYNASANTTGSITLMKP